MDMANPKTYEVIEGLFRDVANIFPDEYMHVGFDEIHLECLFLAKHSTKWMQEHNDLGKDAMNG